MAVFKLLFALLALRAICSSYAMPANIIRGAGQGLGLGRLGYNGLGFGGFGGPGYGGPGYGGPGYGGPSYGGPTFGGFILGGPIFVKSNNGGPAFAGPVFAGPTLTGPAFAGPIFAGSVLGGPIFGGLGNGGPSYRRPGFEDIDHGKFANGLFGNGGLSLKELTLSLMGLGKIGNGAGIHGLDHFAKPKYSFDHGMKNLVTENVKSQKEVRDGGVVEGQLSAEKPSSFPRVADYAVDEGHAFHYAAQRLGSETRIQQ